MKVERKKMGKGAICCALAKKEGSGRRRIVFELLEIAVFDLLHEGFALEQVALEVNGELTRHDEELVVGHFGKRDGAACRNEMRAPLEDKASVPESEDGEQGNRGDKGGALGAEQLSGTIEENGETENKKWSERNEKAIAVGRDAGPIGVTGDEKVKSEKGREKRGAGTALPPPENKKAGDSEEKNWRPGKKAVIGGEEDIEECGGGPEPVPKRYVAGLEGAAVNKIVSDESGEQTDQENGGEEQVPQEQSRNAQRRIGRGGRVGAKGEVILAEDFDHKDGEDHGIGVVNVKHEAGDYGEDQPLRERARGTRFEPIPKKKGHGERSMRMRPRGIEIHVHRKRAGPPDGKRGEERPALFHILARQAEGQKQTEESVDGGGEGHSDAVRRGKTVGSNRGTQDAREKDAYMRDEEKGRPKN